MKRTNLVLDDALLEETLRVSGERTYSKAVERAMSDFIRRARAGQILELAGKGLWEGDLSVMREDRAPYEADPAPQEPVLTSYARAKGKRRGSR